MIKAFLKYDGKNGKVKATIYDTKYVTDNQAIQELKDIPPDSKIAIPNQKFTLVFSHDCIFKGISQTPLPKDTYEDQVEEDEDGFLQLKGD